MKKIDQFFFTIVILLIILFPVGINTNAFYPITNGNFLSKTSTASNSTEPKIAVAQLMANASLNTIITFVEQAGMEDADLVLLPMGLSSIIPQSTTGPVYQIMAALAIRYHMCIVLPIPELTPDAKIYNTALVIDTYGRLIGTYRQTHLSPEDQNKGIIAGDRLPVFDLFFGRIGILLGYDLLFPEAARILTLRGAKLLLYSYAGNTKDEIAPVLQLKENIFFNAYYAAFAGLITSSNDWASGIIDVDCQLLTLKNFTQGIFYARINLQMITSHCSGMPREKFFACRDPYAVAELANLTAKLNPNGKEKGSTELVIATIQCVNNSWEHIAQEVIPRAGQLGADVVLTQEAYLPNPTNLTFEEAESIIAINTLSTIAKNYSMTIIAGICLGVEGYKNARRSAYIIIDPNGNLSGVHYQHTGAPADDFVLFDTGFGVFGGLVCWDLIMMGTEFVRVEALKGASILFYGTLTITSEAFDFVLPSLAKTNVVPIAFSAHANNGFLNPQAGVVGANGTHLKGEIDEGGLGKEIVLTTVNLTLPSDLQNLKEQLWQDRRPELYLPLTKSDVSLPPYNVKLSPANPAPGEQVEIEITTFNAINPQTAAYKLGFAVNGEIIDQKEILYERWSSPPTGAWDFDYRFITTNFTWKATAGKHTLTFKADIDDVLCEICEDNNDVTIELEIKGFETETSNVPVIALGVFAIVIAVINTVLKEKQRRKNFLLSSK
ncbi:MAG: carbon-nitrogen hydrolase family protein [Candidatus Heimdallarchaeota archaeon]|nr:carbon-nitrogen hydrolase family protein [Candidatus Heimdallarchaeota archaeon]